MAQSEAAKSNTAVLVDRIKTLSEDIKIPKERYLTP